MHVNRSDIPGHGEEVKRQTDVRDAAFLHPLTDICGFKIRQMCPIDFLKLDGIGSPFIAGGPATLEDVSLFLRILTAEQPHKWIWFGNYRFGKRCRFLGLEAVKVAIQKYLRTTFQDRPGSSKTSETPYASWCAHLVNNIASEYGWPIETILQTPFRILHQLQNCIRRNHNPIAIIINPSDEKIGAHLALKQQRLNLVNLLASRARN